MNLSKPHLRSMRMESTPSRIGVRKSLFLVLVSLLFSCILFGSSCLAGEVSVPIPSEVQKGGHTVTLPVILHDAQDIDGYQITVSELSGGDISINTTADKVVGTTFTGNNKKAVLMSSSTPLNGDVTLFSVDVTPVSGHNAIVCVEVVEIMSGSESLLSEYHGSDTIIPVTNGKTEYIMDSPNQVKTTATATPTSAVPLYSERTSASQDSSSSSSSTSSSASLSTSSSTSNPTTTQKSPGFLPLTVLLAGGAVAGLFASRRGL